MSSIKEVGNATRGLYESVAQLVRARVLYARVGGSSPSRLTKKDRDQHLFLFWDNYLCHRPCLFVRIGKF